MTPLGLEVKSEAAYDLLQDYTEMILTLLDHPLSRTEVLERLGSEVALARLLKHGLVEASGDRVCAVASVYQQFRQEGMVSFLERYILPSLSTSIADNEGAGFSTLATRYLKLSPEISATMRQGPVQKLFLELAEISERPAPGIKRRFTVMVVGTSRVVDEALDEGSAALKHLQQASLQRATPAERHLAMLSQLDGLVDNCRYVASMEALEDFLRGVEGDRASSIAEANYHLTVASHWRGASANGLETDVGRTC